MFMNLEVPGDTLDSTAVESLTVVTPAQGDTGTRVSIHAFLLLSCPADDLE